MIKTTNRKVYKYGETPYYIANTSEIISRLSHYNNKNKMRLHIITLVLIFSISLTAAVTLYAGDQIEIELDKPYSYYSIVGNSTPINIEVIPHGNNVTIITDKYSQKDSYEIIFFDNEKETITVYRNSGSSGSSKTKWKTEYVDRNITKYETQEIEKQVPGENVEVEKIVNKTHWFVWLVLILLIVTSVYLWFNRNEKEEEKNE